jgi:hypothetical protein
MTTFFTKRSSGLSKPAIAGIAITLSLLAILAVIIITYAWFHRWKLPIFQRPRERTRPKPSRHSERLQSEEEIKPRLKTEERPTSKAAKYWSAEDMTRSKIGSVYSHAPSARAHSTDWDLFKPPPASSRMSDNASVYADSVFSSQTRASAFMNVDGTPQVVRPSSKRLTTWSRHISTQFLNAESPSLPVTTTEDAEPQSSQTRPVTWLETPQAGNEKRNSRSVVTNLDWMEYEPHG